MRQYKKIMAVLLVMLLTLQTPVTALAGETNTPKEEVVYINLNQDGSVREIYVVNIFDLDENGQIIDYGEYETLRNMTTTDDINYSGNKVTIDTSAGKLYYEGKLKEASRVMPWDISIRYYLDGTEYTAEEIAGKSGRLELAMSIRKNQECTGSFFEGYALQATIVLDTETCKNIIAENATIANVGRDKQLTYTILPDRETDIKITADVKNFEMDGISINGIRLNMDIEVDDAELQSKIDEIIDAVNKLDEGAVDLYKGTNDLYEGADDLYSGTSELSSGADSLSEGTDSLHSATGTLNKKVGELHKGVGSLSAGADTLYSGLAALNGKSAELTNGAWAAYTALCTAAQTQLNAELTANGMSEVTLTPDNYAAVLMDILNKLDADAVYEEAYNAALAEVTAQVNARAEELYKAYIDSQAEAIYFQYVQSREDTLYTQVATQAVYEQLISEGYTDEQARAYLQTEAGQEVVAQTVAAMTEEQKTQILDKAVAQLTEEQKAQILQGALDALTDEQKAEIRNAYIEQMMASEEVTQKIAAAVAQVSAAAAKVAELKAQLDSYGTFYQGLVAYTAGVSDAAAGADALQSGLHTLYKSTETLKSSVGKLNAAAGELSEGSAQLNSGAAELHDGAGELHDGAKELNDGAKELRDGTGEFVDETSGMNEEVSEEIDSLLSSVTGEQVEIVSFVSGQNTNVKAVQFVIKTDAIQSEETEEAAVEEEGSLSFWQKLLHLFGFH